MLESILDRRSIRRYRPGAVREEDVKTLLQCAMMAPSAGNGRPWSFVVIDDRAILDELAARHPYAAMLREAPTAICVCARSAGMADYWQQDCAAATMNILIAAKELGLGTCWMGVAPVRERVDMVGGLLKLPEGVSAFNLIALGYPAEERDRPDRWDEGLIHRNRW